MPKELYNEGRVVGLSSYEVYVKEHDSVSPDTDPATEREWLASMMGSGSSMLLKIPANTEHKETDNWIYEVALPTNTNLTAASTVIASYFRGQGRYSKSDVWADGIASYGDLIKSDKLFGYVGPTGSVPTDTLDDWTKAEKLELAQYMKIIDGVIIQPGTWSASGKTPPAKNLQPDLSSYPRIRLHMRGRIESSFQVLLTGFMIKSVVVGQSGIDTSTNTMNPEDGDFLGPAVYPWANKICFYVPSSYINYFTTQAYKRRLPLSSSEKVVDDAPIIDMKTTNPKDYYETGYSLQYYGVDGSKQQDDVNVTYLTSVSDTEAVLTVYQRSEKFPPALWGTLVTQEGQTKLNPLDCVAPGSVKMFNIKDSKTASDVMNDYQHTFPGTNAMNKTPDGEIQTTDKDGNIVSAAKVTVQDISHDVTVSSHSKAKMVVTQTGSNKSMSLSVSSQLNGGQYAIGTANSNKTVSGMGGKGGTSYVEKRIGGTDNILAPSSTLTWQQLLEALANNCGIDVLGDTLKTLRAGIDKNYVQFPNGLRLYISNTAPTDTDIPDGSIGIGWGFKPKK